MTQPIVTKAIDFCAANKLRLTSPRLHVLKIIYSNKKPLKAYDVLKQLGKVIKNPKPPTAYRAIEFWKKNNFIHRIESLNAYTSCSERHTHEGSQFMICNDCGIVIESHLCELPEILKKNIKKNAFKPSSWNLEVNGVCGECV